MDQILERLFNDNEAITDLQNELSNTQEYIKALESALKEFGIDPISEV